MNCPNLLVLLLLVALAQVLQAASVKQALQTHSIGDLAQQIQQSSRNEVRSLPGYDGDLPSKHYAGYITVSEAHGRRLFYYLVTSESDQPSSDPLIIWLTGGPGCSSLDAFTYENGPFKFAFKQGSNCSIFLAITYESRQSGSNIIQGTSARAATLNDILLTRNPYSWSKIANVLYIDSPAGTGMSFSEVRSDYVTDDDRTIGDLEYFVRQFFEEYPELRDLDLYLAGESYGGVYVPLLAQRLLKHNQRLAAAAANPGSSSAAANSSSSSKFEEGYNLQGHIVGNAVTDDEYDGNGQIEFAFGMGLIDPLTYNHAHRTCKGNFWNAEPGTACGNALDRIQAVMGPINQYDILGTCFHQEPQQSQTRKIYQHQPPQTRRLLQQASREPRRVWPHTAVFPHNTPVTNWYSEHKKLSTRSAAAVAHDGSSSSSMLGHTIDCADRRHALIYYNHPDVRRAIHAASIEETGRWEPCSDVLHYTHTAGSMIPVHRDLTSAGIRGLVLSGDHDYVVPFTSSREWVYNLRFEERKPWHAWRVPGQDQVAGYAVEFEDGITFATVKGGGHMVPQTNPREALALLELWLDRHL